MRSALHRTCPSAESLGGRSVHSKLFAVVTGDAGRAGRAQPDPHREPVTVACDVGLSLRSVPVSDGTRFGNYVLEKRLAVGGMAEVWRADRLGAAGFAKPVCVKKILPSLSEDPDFVQMFIDEAKIGAQLRHGNIVAIDDFGEFGGQYFLAMEFIAGTDLARLLGHLAKANRNLPLDVAVLIASDVLRALDYAHRKLGADGNPLGVVHRDVSPHNLLVSFAGEVKLTDFGIAKAESRQHRTVGIVVKGKLGYMAPEQRLSVAIDGRADLFALGVVFYEMVVGQLPFRAAKDVDLVVASLHSERKTVLEARPEVPAVVAAVIERLLAPSLADRYASAGDALADLAAFPIGAQAVRQLASLVAQIDPDHPSASRTAVDFDMLPRRDPNEAGVALDAATMVEESATSVIAAPMAALPALAGEPTMVEALPLSPGGTEIAPTGVTVGVAYADTRATRRGGSRVASRTDADEPRETSPTSVTRTIAIPLDGTASSTALAPVAAPSSAITSGAGQRVLTFGAFIVLAAAAAALAYVVFAH